MPAIVVNATQGETSPEPSKIYSARALGEFALQLVGAYSVNDTAADTAELERAINWLELVVAETAGVKECTWLVKATARFPWPAGEAVLEIDEAMGDQYPSLGILRPISANLINAEGDLVDELPLIRRYRYEQINNKTEAGTPQVLYFDRLAVRPTVAIHRVPENDNEHYIDLTFQTYAPSVLGLVSGGSEQAGNLAHNFSQEWQLYLIQRTAAWIGQGPVRRLSAAQISAWMGDATDRLENLMSGSNRERSSEPARTAPHGRY